MSDRSEYDPVRFWNRKALESAGDPAAAVCHPWPEANRNIDRIQCRLIHRAIQNLSPDGGLVGSSVLDYGCGSGRWAPFFRERGADYSGVEVAPEMLSLAVSEDPVGDYRLLDFGTIPYPDGRFDLVCSVGVLHHNPPEEQERILEEFVRVLKSDGHLLLFESVGAPDPYNPIEFARPKDDWAALLRGSGFEGVYYEGARYFALRSLVECVGRRLGFSDGTGGRRWWYGPLERIGLLTDPHLGRFLPEAFHDRAVMLFRLRG